MKTASLLTIFFSSLLSLIASSLATQAWADDCAPKSDLIWVNASYAVSGDSILIQGGKFKLIGIYAPQIPRQHKFNTPGHPMAKESQTFLNKILANNDLRIGVEYDEARIDKFNRQLAHFFLEDGTNIQEKIIESGYALANTSNHNTLHASCYFKAEQRARESQYQLWDLAAKNPELHFPVVKSTELRREDDGFRIIQGKVEQVERSSNNIIINLDTTGIRIPKQHWKHFDYNRIKQLKGQTIEVRGVGFLFKGAMFVVIDHPNAIDKLNPLAAQ